MNVPDPARCGRTCGRETAQQTEDGSRGQWKGHSRLLYGPGEGGSCPALGLSLPIGQVTPLSPP